MRVLALDTTTRVGAVALVEDDRVVDEQIGEASRPHAQRLLGDVMALLKRCDVGLPEIDVFAAASGPGSFTGLRIGIATIQGLAFVHRRPVVGVSALEALAQAVGAGAAPASTVAAWMDAHRREVFSALYRVVGLAEALTPERLEAIEPAAVGDPGATLARWAALAEPPAVAVGDGAVLYGDLVRRSLPRTVIVEPPCLAGVVGRLAIAYARRGDAVQPGGLRPLYVRRPDAEIARAGKA